MENLTSLEYKLFVYDLTEILKLRFALNTQRTYTLHGGRGGGWIWRWSMSIHDISRRTWLDFECLWWQQTPEGGDDGRRCGVGSVWNGNVGIEELSSYKTTESNGPPIEWGGCGTLNEWNEATNVCLCAFGCVSFANTKLVLVQIKWNKRRKFYSCFPFFLFLFTHFLMVMAYNSNWSVFVSVFNFGETRKGETTRGGQQWEKERNGGWKTAAHQSDGNLLAKGKASYTKSKLDEMRTNGRWWGWGGRWWRWRS